MSSILSRQALEVRDCQHCQTPFQVLRPQEVGKKRFCSELCRKRSEHHRTYKNRSSKILERFKNKKYYLNKSIEESLYRNAKRRCKETGLDFTIELSDIPKMPKHCPITGLELRRGEGSIQEYSPTLDRIDNSKGYIPGNVQIISNRANKRKSDLTLDEIKRLYEYCFGN